MLDLLSGADESSAPLCFVGLTIHLTHHVEQMKKSQRISAINLSAEGREDTITSLSLNLKNIVGQDLCRAKLSSFGTAQTNFTQPRTKSFSQSNLSTSIIFLLSSYLFGNLMPSIHPIILTCKRRSANRQGRGEGKGG